MPLLSTESTWLALYFLSNLTLTLYNKCVLVRFPFPYSLTAFHTLCGTFGGYALMEHGAFEAKRLDLAQNSVLLAFSILYATNIAVSNISLGLVTVPFHQVVRAATPIFVMLLSAWLLQARYSDKKRLSLLPVIAGVGLATYGDYYFTTWGLFLTLLGTLLAALKTIMTNVLQSPNAGTSSSNSKDAMLVRSLGSFKERIVSLRLHLHPLDLLARMSPLAFIQCVTYAHLSGELDRVRYYSARDMTPYKFCALISNGLLAFALNIVSFTANKKVGPLSMTVAANVKQVLTILIAVFLFDLNITPLNGLGIALTLLGGAWYTIVEYSEKISRMARPQANAK